MIEVFTCLPPQTTTVCLLHLKYELNVLNVQPKCLITAFKVSAIYVSFECALESYSSIYLHASSNYHCMITAFKVSAIYMSFECALESDSSQSSAIRFVDTLPHFLIRVYSWKCWADGCYRQMWQVSCRRQGMLTQRPAPDPKSKV